MSTLGVIRNKSVAIEMNSMATFLNFANHYEHEAGESLDNGCIRQLQRQLENNARRYPEKQVAIHLYGHSTEFGVNNSEDYISCSYEVIKGEDLIWMDVI